MQYISYSLYIYNNGLHSVQCTIGTIGNIAICWIWSTGKSIQCWPRLSRYSRGGEGKKGNILLIFYPKVRALFAYKENTWGTGKILLIVWWHSERECVVHSDDYNLSMCVGRVGWQTEVVYPYITTTVQVNSRLNSEMTPWSMPLCFPDQYSIRYLA